MGKKKVKLFGTAKNLVVCAMLTAMSVAIGMFCKNFMDFGGGAFRITFENLPIILSGILYGPIVGAVVGAYSDLISYLFSNQAYPPNLIVTLGAASVGIISGLVSKFIVPKKGSLQVVLSGGLAHLVGSLIIKSIGLFQFYQYLVFWRIPIYLVIASVEIFLLCTILKRKSFARVIGYVHEEKSDRMSYEEAIDYIHKINWCFCNPGLERIEKLCEALGNPQKGLKFIHVAGTNGKGSFCAMLSTVLTSAGYKTGLFTSPYVKFFNERMAIDGEMISNNELVELVEKIKPIADSMDEKPTEFELITAIAFEYFSKNNCDVVVLECGLGGRLDSTNVIEAPELSVITGIALDHTSILGSTIEEIANEKAGIIKQSRPCLWCGSSCEAEKVISRRATELGSPLIKPDHSSIVIEKLDLNGTEFSYKSHEHIFIPLLGTYQPYNATNVLSAIDVLRSNGMEISESAVSEGMARVKWHARFEIICKDPLIIADGGHNPEGVKSAVDSVKKYFGKEKLNVISGVMSDKDYNYIAEQIGEIANKVYCVTPDNPRALSSDKYAEIYNSNGVNASSYQSISSALDSAIRDSILEKRAILCVGSLYSYSDICKYLDEADLLVST